MGLVLLGLAESSNVAQGFQGTILKPYLGRYQQRCYSEFIDQLFILFLLQAIMNLQ